MLFNYFCPNRLEKNIKEYSNTISRAVSSAGRALPF